MDLNLLQMEREDSEEHEEMDSEGHDAKDSKRKKKTPLQIEMLEVAYAADSHPSEAARIELSIKSGLTNRQIQMWFCNRRLKNRKCLMREGEGSFLLRKEDKGSLSEEPLTFYEYPAAVLASEVEDDTLFRRNTWEQVANGRDESLSEVGHRRKVQGKEEFTTSLKKRSKQSPRIDPRAAAIALLCSWGETFREDGPTLGFDFDLLPPGAFSTESEQGLGNNSIAEADNHFSMSYAKEDISLIKSFTGQKPGVVPRQYKVPQNSGTISKFRKNKSLDLQHIQCAPRLPSDLHFELTDAQYLQTMEKMPGATIPTSRKMVHPPKPLLPSSMKPYIKQDGYAFLKNKRERSLFAPNIRKASSNESIVSSQYPPSSYIKPHHTYGEDEFVYYSYNGHAEDVGSDGNFQSSEYSDDEVNAVEAEERVFGEQCRQKGTLNFRKDFGYQFYKCHDYNTGSSGNTNE